MMKRIWSSVGSLAFLVSASLLGQQADVRHAYKSYGPIADSADFFVPGSADDPMPLYLPESLRQRLISNGTYTADGKVNLETARRLGWDKIWEERSRPVPQSTP